MKKSLSKILIIITIFVCILGITAFAEGTTEMDSSNFAVLSNNITTATTLTENMRVDGDLKLKSNLNLNGFILVVDGNLTQTSGTISVGNGMLKVSGSYTAQGEFDAGSGRTEIGGNFSTSSISERFKFVMNNESAYVLVGGDFSIAGGGVASSAKNITAGTLELKGDFKQHGGSWSNGVDTSYGFKATDSHKVVLSGVGEQIITFDKPTCSYFNILESTNQSGKIKLDNVRIVKECKIGKVHTDVLNLYYCPDIEINELSCTTIKLTANTNLKIKNVANADNVTLDDSNITLIDNAQMNVNNNFLFDGTVSVGMGVLSIGGNLTQTGGTINVGNGMLKVSGSYTAQGEFDAGSGRTEIGGNFSTSSISERFKFVMNNESAYVLVGGDFSIAGGGVASSAKNITAGTLELKGDFKQHGGSWSNGVDTSYGFKATDSHKVVLSGVGEQIITFQTPSCSYFNEIINNNPDGVKFLSWSEYQTYLKNNGTSKFTVTFDTIVDGKTTTKVNASSYLTNLPTPTHTGLKFAAWYKDKDYKNMWVDNIDKVTSDITLYARWAKASSDRSDIYDPYSVTLSPRRYFTGVIKSEMPLVPSTKTSEYASELYEWAKEFGYDDIITEEAAKEIVEKYMPTTYRVGESYIRDNRYDTKAVMRDIIMLNSTKKSIYNWEDEFLVPNYSTKATDLNKRVMKILEGYADYCNSVDRNPVTNALYTVATTSYTNGKDYAKGKLETAGYDLADYILYSSSGGGNPAGFTEKYWSEAKGLYNSYRNSTLSLEGDVFKDLAVFSAIDFSASVIKSSFEDCLEDALSLNDTTSQMYTMYSKLKSIGGFIGDGFSSAIAPYKLAYELLEYTVDEGKNVNKAFVFLTQYHFINRYPEWCDMILDENNKITRDVFVLNNILNNKLDKEDYIGKILVTRLLQFDGIKDSIIFSLDDETNFAMMQSAVTMNLIDGLNVNSLRKDLVEYWASVYSGEPVAKTNVYIPSGSSCTVSESVSLMSLSDNGYVATLDENGEFETTSENVSVIGRTDDAIIVEVIGDYNIQLSNATDNVLISQTTENAGNITNNIVSLYEANSIMNIATAGEEIFVTATDGTGEEKIAEPIATLDDTANKLLADADALTITFDAGDSADSVKNNLILSDVGGYGSEISWESSNTSVITDDGKVTRNITDQTVTMTATLTLNNQKIKKSFDVVVKANTVYITVEDCVVEDNSVDVNAYAVNELSTDKDGVVIIALYNQNRLVGTHIQDVSTTSQTSANVKYEFLNCNFAETDTPVVKVFWWTDLEKLVPLCNSVSKEVQ